MESEEMGKIMESFCEETTLQICQICLRLRLTPAFWIVPTTDLYRELLRHKPFTELTACPACLANFYLLGEKKEEKMIRKRFVCAVCGAHFKTLFVAAKNPQSQTDKIHTETIISICDGECSRKEVK